MADTQDMIADDIIEAVARHRQIKPAVEQMIRHGASINPPGVTTVSCDHEFVCEVRGQKYDVKISLQVAGQKKH
jgi:hypothetical protein